MVTQSKGQPWITAWFLVSALLVSWDAGYCFMRPRSMVGGDLHWIWKPYSLYAEVDHVYGLPSLDRGDGFPNAQSFMNVVETLTNLAYVYYAHVQPSGIAPLIGFSGAIMTLSKTVLYWLQDYYCSWCTTGHNPPLKWIILFALPNTSPTLLAPSTVRSTITMTNDYRAILYRLDLATSYSSVPALLQHFMDESPLDGTIELRVVTSPTPSSNSPHIPTPPRSPNPQALHTMLSAPEHYMSFARSEDSRDVYARHTFGIPPDPELSSPTQRSAYIRTPVLTVTHEFAPKTPVISAFTPVIEHFLRNDHELSSVIFECRSYLQPPEPKQSKNPLEILDRPAPYKRMFGYVGRVRGGTTIYELDDTVTGTMFSTVAPINFPLPP